jgi:hypothetical protein
MSNLQSLNTANRRIDQLANKMVALHQEGHDVTETLLLAEGFSPFELSTYGVPARNLANQRFVRRINAVGLGQSNVSEGFTKTDEEWTDIGARHATGLVDHTLIFAQLRAFGIPSVVLGRIWPRLMKKLAIDIGTRPLPQSPSLAQAGMA